MSRRPQFIRAPRVRWQHFYPYHHDVLVRSPRARCVGFKVEKFMNEPVMRLIIIDEPRPSDRLEANQNTLTVILEKVGVAGHIYEDVTIGMPISPLCNKLLGIAEFGGDTVAVFTARRRVPPYEPWLQDEPPEPFDDD